MKVVQINVRERSKPLLRPISQSENEAESSKKNLFMKDLVPLVLLGPGEQLWTGLSC